MEAANAGQKFQSPFCQPHGRALVDGFSPILELPALPTTTVTVLVDPPGAMSDVQSIILRSQVILRACFIPSKGMPLKIPATLKFPLGDQLNAGCRVTPKSTWATVNVPLIQKLAKPNEDIVLQFRQPPPGPPPKKDGRGEINIVLNRGIHSIPPYMRFVSYSPQDRRAVRRFGKLQIPAAQFPAWGYVQETGERSSDPF